MSEPIELYDINGEVVVIHSPMVAKNLVDQGELFISPPLVIEEVPTVRSTRRTKKTE